MQQLLFAAKKLGGAISPKVGITLRCVMYLTWYFIYDGVPQEPFDHLPFLIHVMVTEPINKGIYRLRTQSRQG